MTEEQATTPQNGVADSVDDDEPAVDAVAELEVRAERAEGQWRRTAADLDNLQKRFLREVARERAAERERVTLLWLVMLDDLDRSVAYAERPERTTVLVDGVEAIINNAIASIAALGYPRFAQVGDTFDTGLHEVISTIPTDADHPDNTIAAVIKAGSGTRENLLRPASVVVATDAV